MNKEQVIEYYLDEIKRTDAEIAGFKTILSRLSFLRLGSFLAAVAGVYFFGAINLYYGLAAGGILIIAFFWFVLRYLRVTTKLSYSSSLRKVLQNELDVLSERTNVYANGSEFSIPAHSYSDDLDIFGETSVFHYINRCVTQFGNHKLADWLKDVPEKAIIEERQEAVAELKEYVNETRWFRAYLLPYNGNELQNISFAIKHQFKKLLDFTDSSRLKLYAIIAPYLIPVLLLVAFTTDLDWKIIFLPVVLNYLINGRYSKKIFHLHEIIGKNSERIKVYAIVLKWIEETHWKSEYLASLINTCKNDRIKLTAFKQTEKLAELVRLLDYRLNIMVSIVLNLGFLWDIRCIYKIRKWHETSSDTIAKSFEVLGEFEALVSLSTLTYNHPEWSFPQLKEGFEFDAKVMGHPLIPVQNRIYNDFCFSERKTVDVITGSNMAGKSTFLRTIGVNMVLAFAGAPVCCEKLVLSPVKLVSYMRIKDSLNESTSTFKAEINRLKMILDVSRTENAFALIDEMLRGTNSHDKYLGTKAFIKKLIEQHSAAIIATHDLQVAELAKEYPGQIRNYHFDIQTDGREMFFDYKIKDGECKTFNASILLRQIGLDIDEIKAIRGGKAPPLK